MRKFALKQVAAVAGLSLLTISAPANTITLGDVASGPAGGSFWTYSYSFANSTVQPGDFFTINDFGPAAVGFPPIVPGGFWVFSQALVGLNSIPAADDPTKLNATFTWTGAAIGMGPGVVGPFTFQLLSPFAPIGVLDDYTSQDHSFSAGTISRAIGQITVPLGTTVPDGGFTLSLIGLALMGIEGLRRKLRN